MAISIRLANHIHLSANPGIKPQILLVSRILPFLISAPGIGRNFDENC